ncbi:MAG: PA domain-containing protein [Myxococcota bacterium]
MAWQSVASTSSTDSEPFVALADRDASQSFAERVKALADLGAAAVVIANSRAGPELFAMGGSEDESKVPAVLVSKETGQLLKKRAAKAPLFVELSAHPAVRGVRPLADQILPGHRELHSFRYGPHLRYVTRTLPVTFKLAARTFVPQQRKIYPPVLKLPSCRLCASSSSSASSEGESPRLVLEAVPSLDSSSSLASLSTSGGSATPSSMSSSSSSTSPSTTRAAKFKKKKKVYQQKTKNTKKKKPPASAAAAAAARRPPPH